MRAPAILVVQRGGGYVKAILPRRRETVFGRDDGELAGRLKTLGFRDPLAMMKRKKTK
jgi:hypothetical protein